jgi:hypothetical protein
MTIAVEQLCEGLEHDLCLTRLEHLAIRARLQCEDTAANRAAEVECRRRLDVILDLLVELKDDAAGRALARHPLAPGRPRRIPAPGPTG